MSNVGHLVKESIVEELKTALSDQPNFFVTGLTHLPAPEVDAFRRKLFASQARLFVVKRRLGGRAIEPFKITGLPDLLEGSVGLVLSGEDVLPIAKLIVEFTKTHEDQLNVRGAVIDGQLVDRRGVEHLASLPPKPMLLAQVVATIESPMADVILTLERLIGELAWLAEQAAAQKPTELAQPASAASAPATIEESTTPRAQQPPTTQEGTSS